MNTRPTSSQLAALSRSDPKMGKLLKQVGPFPDLKRQNTADSHFHALARTIIYQQLAGKAAATIHNRFRSLTPGARFPNAEEVCTLRTASFRKAGISGSKQKALKALASAVTKGQIKLRSLSRLDDDRIIEQLTQLHGIGEWSAQMFLMFRLGRLNVMPTTDLGIQEGLRVLDSLDRRPKPLELRERSRKWAPLCSVASWCLYRAVDQDRAKRRGSSA